MRLQGRGGEAGQPSKRCVTQSSATHPAWSITCTARHSLQRQEQRRAWGLTTAAAPARTYAPAPRRMISTSESMTGIQIHHPAAPRSTLSLGSRVNAPATAVLQLLRPHAPAESAMHDHKRPESTQTEEWRHAAQRSAQECPTKTYPAKQHHILRCAASAAMHWVAGTPSHGLGRACRRPQCIGTVIIITTTTIIIIRNGSRGAALSAPVGAWYSLWFAKLLGDRWCVACLPRRRGRTVWG